MSKVITVQQITNHVMLTHLIVIVNTYMRLQYLESATCEIEMLQQEVEKLENQLSQINKITVHDFI